MSGRVGGAGRVLRVGLGLGVNVRKLFKGIRGLLAAFPFISFLASNVVSLSLKLEKDLQIFPNTVFRKLVTTLPCKSPI